MARCAPPGIIGKIADDDLGVAVAVHVPIRGHTPVQGTTCMAASKGWRSAQATFASKVNVGLVPANNHVIVAIPVHISGRGSGSAKTISGIGSSNLPVCIRTGYRNKSNVKSQPN